MKIKRIEYLLLFLVTVFVLSALCGCVSNKDNSEDGTTEVTQSDQTTEEQLPPEVIHTSDEYSGIEIIRVYGNGGKDDAPLKNGFVTIRNTSGKDILLEGLALYLKKTDGVGFSEYRFDAKILKSGNELTVSGKDTENYNQVFEILRVGGADVWNVEFDNKNICLYLSPAGLDPEVFTKDFVSVFDTDASGITLGKNKIAVREDGKITLYSVSGMTAAEALEKFPELQYVKNGGVKLDFSCPAGFYDDAFELTLSAPAGCDIFYTTDGSDPTKYGVRYQSPILIERSDEMTWGKTIKAGIDLMGLTPSQSFMPGGRVIRAYATDGRNSTQVLTNTYFVIPGFSTYGVTVMNMSVDVDDFIGTETGAYYTYQFDLWNTRPRSTVYLEVFSPNGNRVGNSYVEFAVSGNGSSGLPMKSLRLYYKSGINKDTGNPKTLEYDLFDGYATDIYGKTIDSFSRILIRNSGNDYNASYIRDALCQRLAKDSLVDSMAYAQTLVFVNGELWGLYNCRERYSQEYFASHYGVDKNNVVVIENVSPLANGSWNSDYVLAQGEEGDEQDFHDLYAYICANDLSIEENYRYVESRLDIDSYIDYWIYSVYLDNGDWPGNNIKVWRNKNPEDPSGMDTKWRYCLLDMDFCLTNVNSNQFGSANGGTVNGNIMHRLSKNAEFREKLAIRGYYLVQTVFAPEVSLPILEDMAADKSGLLWLQYARWGGNYETWEANINQIRTFLKARVDYFLLYLCKFSGISQEDMASRAPGSVCVNFQPEKVSVKIDGTQVSANLTVISVPAGKGGIRVEVIPVNDYKIDSIEYITDDGQSEKYYGTTVNIPTEKSGKLYIHTVG